MSGTVSSKLGKLGEDSDTQCEAQAMSGAVAQQAGCRISLREQIEGRFYQTQQAAHESTRLGRLRRMIEKNPETFEMISLMRDLGLI